MKRGGSSLLLFIFLVSQSPGLVLAAADPRDERERPARRSVSDVAGEPPALIARAYADALIILREENSCSRYFGGPGAGAEALGRLVARLRPGMMRDSHIGIRMSGEYTFYSRAGIGFSYRLFKEERVNTAGPFYRAKSFPTEPLIPNVGGFRPNTREARVLMLLHELGHLIEGADGEWLLPDDAHNPEQNSRNTTVIESRCREQILSLR